MSDECTNKVFQLEFIAGDTKKSFAFYVNNLYFNKNHKGIIYQFWFNDSTLIIFFRSLARIET